LVVAADIIGEENRPGNVGNAIILRAIAHWNPNFRNGSILLKKSVFYNV